LTPPYTAASLAAVSVLKLIRRTVGLAALTTTLAAVAAAPASAAPVTVGQLLAPNFECNASTANITFIQTAVSSGTAYTIPVDGVVTSWSFQAGSKVLEGLKFKVARLLSGSNWKVVGESAAGAQAINTASTFAVSIPVQAGDRIGIWGGAKGGTCGYQTFLEGDSFAGYLGDAPLNSELPFSSESQLRIPVSATVQPIPRVSSVTPASGPPAGGTQVTIRGEDFTGATAVSFGGAQVAFHLDSDTQITTSSPAGPLGAVDVRVTTQVGQSPAGAADQFTYATPPPEVKPIESKPTESKPTGKRTAALKKCRKKHGKARKKCIKRARKLPL
jgi:hypothetical protein